ncbi:phage tail protein [Rhizobium sp. L43]|uniref:phage tail protein n=1 Tax=Rhizobium sp. L43 TaxID=2035452 RepID=UPI000BE9D3A3|nr:phage tail protein [Rhizobium sp. L43]PDS75514.1 hypothetical protein CO667_26470 [Rhizobium sp. L43]
MGAQKRAFDRENARGLCTNSGNAYALTYDVPPDDYYKGAFFSFFVSATNTGAATLSINGMPAKALTQNNGSALTAGDLIAGVPITVTYDGTKFRLLTTSANQSFAGLSATSVSATSVTATSVAATTVAATTGMTINSLPVFTTANDGAGSGLDSDKLDGQEGSWYQARANHTGTQDVATISGLQAILDTIVPASTVIYVAQATAPTGYLAANGAAVSRTTYSRLFTAIGTTFGAGDGSNTFNVPDLRGEFVRGLDSGRGVDSGRTLGSAQSSQNLAHSHGGATASNGPWGLSVTAYTSTEDSLETQAGGTPYAQGKPKSTTTMGTGTVPAHGHSISSDGGSEARPRNVALLACIKV